MAIIADVVNGKLDYTYTDPNAKDKATIGQANLGYDQFLQLLCAEMQYQDPLEPTSNTDYIAQLATFSQLEATLSQTDKIEDQAGNVLDNTVATQATLASSLVGKNVIIYDQETENYVSGTVDYIMYGEDGGIYLAVNETLYPLEYLDTVADSKYFDAVTLSNTFKEMLTALPAYGEIDTSFKTMVEQLIEMYDGMSDYEKSFVDGTSVKTMNTYKEIMEKLVADEEAAKGEEVEN